MTAAVWEDAQVHEAAWWGDCRNTFAEEIKQVQYAWRMGIPLIGQTASGSSAVFPSWDAQGATVVDIGGGPVSMLLKTYGCPRSMVVDPGQYPHWTRSRYTACGIEVAPMRGEDFIWPGKPWDEAWLYNVLEHVEDPALVVANARRSSKKLRVFEWIDPPEDDAHDEMHPVHLTAQMLDDLYGDGSGGTVEPDLKIIKGTNELPGTAYYGVFPGDA